MRVGPEELSEANCNGHADVEQINSQWRNEDQHNGNTESPEEQHKESPVYLMCNGVDSTDVNELDTETEGKGAHSCEVPERQLSVGLEERELEQSLLQEEGEDHGHCPYRTQESLRNGQSTKSVYLESVQAVCIGRSSLSHATVMETIGKCLFFN